MAITIALDAWRIVIGPISPSAIKAAAAAALTHQGAAGAGPPFIY